jgi:hypothetical protein
MKKLDSLILRQCASTSLMSYGNYGTARRCVAGARFSHVPEVPGSFRAPFKETPVRPPGFSQGRLPPEWLNAIRQAQQHPGPEPNGSLKPVAPSKAESTGSYEHAPELRSLIGRLKRARIGQGLSLGDVSKLSQQARSALSRLESGEYANPTLHTLYRYARALGWHIRFSAEPIAEPPRPGSTEAEPRRK